MIAALIPAFNCSKTIGEVVRGALKHTDFVIVVDDGSRDATARLAREAGAQVIRLQRNVGKAAAMAAGIRRLVSRETDFAVFLDADLQHDPQEIPRLLGPVMRGRCDICIGSRMLDDHSIMPLHRRFTNRLVSAIASVMTSYPLTDVQSGYRVLSFRALRGLSRFGKDYAIEVETVLEARKKGMRIAEVPISTRYGNEKSYINPLKTAMNLVGILAREFSFK